MTTEEQSRLLEAASHCLAAAAQVRMVDGIDQKDGGIADGLVTVGRELIVWAQNGRVG